jgi:hypothetical protein
VANGQYILDKDGNPVPERNFLKWAMWLEFSHLSPDKDNRIIAKDYIGEVHISTVFLGLDHGWDGGKPLLWETMIFGGDHDSYQRRYTSREDAEEGHRAAIRLVEGRDIKELEHLLAISGGWEKK